MILSSLSIVSTPETLLEARGTKHIGRRCTRCALETLHANKLARSYSGAAVKVGAAAAAAAAARAASV
jgi:hypothetical protein